MKPVTEKHMTDSTMDVNNVLGINASFHCTLKNLSIIYLPEQKIKQTGHNGCDMTLITATEKNKN